MTGVKNTLPGASFVVGIWQVARSRPGPAHQLLLALILASVSACGPIVSQPTFSTRPESLEPGDLLGPFDGMVVDSETERPIAEATISASWAFERGLGAVGPAGHRTVTLLTTPDGRYELPRLADLPSGASTRVARFTLVVYRRGYTGWRSDQIFPVAGPRRDFSQRRAVVRMSRWREGQSHAQHLAFLGGAPAIQAAAAWERQAAAQELRQPAGGVEAPAPRPALLDATPLLSEADVRALSGYTQPLEQGRLPDLPRSEFYDSVHFRAEAVSTQREDVALRLWRLGSAAAEAQYQTLLNELPEPEARGEIADASVRIATEDVRAVVFLVREPGFVVSVTCGVGQCETSEAVLQLARLVEGRLAQIPPAPTTGGVDAPAGDSPAEDDESEVLDPFVEPATIPQGSRP